MFCALRIFSHFSEPVAQDGSTWANIGLKMSEHSPKMGQHSPKMGQHSSKMGQHSPKICPQTTNNRPPTPTHQPQTSKHNPEPQQSHFTNHQHPTPTYPLAKSPQKLPRFTVFCALRIFSHFSEPVAQDGSTWANIGLKMGEHSPKMGQHSPQDGPT